MQRITFKKTVRLIIPEDVYEKQRFLCQKSPTKEWSGLLLYEMQGSINDLDSILLIAKDIIPLDIGTSATTEFRINNAGFDPHIDYCINNPEALNWKIGLIHSHHNMNTFFSSTDWKELETGSSSYSSYLSVIVNNDYNIIGKLAFCASQKIKENLNLLVKNDDDSYSPYSDYEYVNKIEVLYNADCEIFTDKKVLDKTFLNTYNQIVEKSKSKKYFAPVFKSNKAFINNVQKEFDFSQNFDFDLEDDWDFSENDLLINLLRLNDIQYENDTVGKAIEDISLSNKSISQYISDFKSIFEDRLNYYFPNASIEERSIICQICKEELRNYLIDYPFLRTIIKIFDEKSQQI